MFAQRLVTAAILLGLVSCASPIPSEPNALDLGATQEDPSTTPMHTVASAADPSSDPVTGSSSDQTNDDGMTWEVVNTLASEGQPSFIVSTQDQVWVSHESTQRIDVFGATTRVLVDQINTTNNRPSHPAVLLTVGSDVWVAPRTVGRLGRFHSATRDHETLTSLDSRFGYMAVVDDEVWVANREESAIEILDALDGNPLDSMKLGAKPRFVSVVEEEVWVSNDQDEVTAFDAVTHEPLRSMHVPGLGFMIPVDNDVWISTETGVQIVDSATGVTKQILDLDDSAFMVRAGGSVLVGSRANPEILVVDIASQSTTQTITLPSIPGVFSLAGESVWVTLPLSDQVVVVATRSTEVPSSQTWRPIGNIEELDSPVALTADGTTVWIADRDLSLIKSFDSATLEFIQNYEPLDDHPHLERAPDLEEYPRVRIAEALDGAMASSNGILWVVDYESSQLKALFPDGAEVIHDLGSLGSRPNLMSVQDNIWITEGGLLGVLDGFSAEWVYTEGVADTDYLLAVQDDFWTSTPKENRIEIRSATGPDDEDTHDVYSIDIAFPTLMATVGDMVWVDTGNQTGISIVDPVTRTVVGTLPLQSPSQILEVGGTVWLVGRDGMDIKIVDSVTGELVQTLVSEGSFGTIIKVGDEVWALASADNEDHEVVIYGQTN